MTFFGTQFLVSPQRQFKKKCEKFKWRWIDSFSFCRLFEEIKNKKRKSNAGLHKYRVSQFLKQHPFTITLDVRLDVLNINKRIILYFMYFISEKKRVIYNIEVKI